MENGTINASGAVHRLMSLELAFIAWANLSGIKDLETAWHGEDLHVELHGTVLLRNAMDDVSLRLVPGSGEWGTPGRDPRLEESLRKNVPYAFDDPRPTLRNNGINKSIIDTHESREHMTNLLQETFPGTAICGFASPKNNGEFLMHTQALVPWTAIEAWLDWITGSGNEAGTPDCAPCPGTCFLMDGMTGRILADGPRAICEAALDKETERRVRAGSSIANLAIVSRTVLRSAGLTTEQARYAMARGMCGTPDDPFRIGLFRHAIATPLDKASAKDWIEAEMAREAGTGTGETTVRNGDPEAADVPHAYGSEEGACGGKYDCAGSPDVMGFIDGIYEGRTPDEQEAIREFFRSGYCYYFAHMLKLAMGRGKVCHAYPLSHVVWLDDDETPYDCEGVNASEYEMLLDIDRIHGLRDSFLHVPGVESPDDVRALVDDAIRKDPSLVLWPTE